MPVQVRNSDAIGLQAADYQKRNEPNFAAVNVGGALIYMPQARGGWPITCRDQTDALMDVCGFGRTLTNVNGATFSSEGLANCALLVSGSSQYFQRADEAGLDTVGAAGMAFYGWFKFVADGSFPIAAKWNTTGNRSWSLNRAAATDSLTFSCSSSGSAATTVTQAGTSGRAPINQWLFIACRFNPGSTMSIFTGRDIDTLAAGVPASMFGSTANFRIGTDGNVTAYADMQVGPFGLAGQALSDSYIFNFYEQTRSLFGV